MSARNAPAKFNLKIDAELMASLTAKAETDCRSVTSLINVILASWDQGRFYRGNFPAPPPDRAAAKPRAVARFVKPEGRPLIAEDHKPRLIGMQQGLSKTLDISADDAVFTLDDLKANIKATNPPGKPCGLENPGTLLYYRRCIKGLGFHEAIDREAPDPQLTFYKINPFLSPQGL